MHQYRIVWEHEEKNREVEILVDYRVLYHGVQVLNVRPTKVSLYDAATATVKRELKVWTEAGRSLLNSQYLASRVGLPTLEDEINAELAERYGMLSPV